MEMIGRRIWGDGRAVDILGDVGQQKPERTRTRKRPAVAGRGFGPLFERGRITQSVDAAIATRLATR